MSTSATTAFPPARLPARKSFDNSWLLALALLGFSIPNGIFLYVALTAPALLLEALANPISAVFMAEAFALTFLFAWLLHRRNNLVPGWLGFIVLSLVGSLIFSVPLTLYLMARRAPAPPRVDE